MTRISALALGLSLCIISSVQAQICYPTQSYYSAYPQVAYQPAVSPSQSTFYHQPSLNSYVPNVSTYFYTAPLTQAAPAYQAPACQTMQNYPPLGMLSPTPLLISSDCDGCDRIKEIEKKIADLKARLNSSGTSSLQKQLDLHEEDIERQAKVLEKLATTIRDLNEVVKDLADITLGEESPDEENQEPVDNKE